MQEIDLLLLQDIEKIRQISIVPTLLEVICRSTGMGFAAIARVTQDKWIACDTRDEINFGLLSGGELKIETTICNEIRDHHKPVVINNVAQSAEFATHHTPRIYGFQSYISVPIFRKNGEFFGTLCAIDPKPAVVDDTKTIGMFNLFAELIAFHLESLEQLQLTNLAVKELNKQLNESADENRQYQYISNHNLQEPLRKLRVFSDVLVKAVDSGELEKVKDFSIKINTSAQRFSMMIQDLSDFRQLNHNDAAFEEVDLNKVVSDVCTQLKIQLEEKKANIKIDTLPTVNGITVQMEQLFFHLINNAIKFSKKNEPLTIRLRLVSPDPDHLKLQTPDGDSPEYSEIRIEDNGVGIEQLHLEKIFDIFSKMDYDKTVKGEGIGLAYCRRIVRNHRGSITAISEINKGTSFCILLPVIKVIYPRFHPLDGASM